MFDTIVISENHYINTITLQRRGWKKMVPKNVLMESYMFSNNKLQMFYYPLLRRLFVKFSIPRLLFNNNAQMFFESYTPILQQKFQYEMFKLLGKRPPNILEWEVHRIDPCYNFICPNEKDKRKYILMAQKSNYGHCKTKKFYSGAFFYNKSLSYKLYDKAEEMYYRSQSVPSWVKKILRFEVTLRRRKIREAFNNKKSVKVKDVLKDEFGKKILEKYLQKIHLDQKIMKRSELIQLVRNKTTNLMEKGLLKFINEINMFGEAITKEKYSKKTYYRRIALLKELGISSFFIADDIESPISFIIKIPKESKPRFNNPVFSILLPQYFSSYYFEEGG